MDQITSKEREDFSLTNVLDVKIGNKLSRG